jgi:hypothetical protein
MKKSPTPQNRANVGKSGAEGSRVIEKLPGELLATVATGIPAAEFSANCHAKRLDYWAGMLTG